MDLRTLTIQPARSFSFSFSPETRGMLWVVLVSLAIMTPTLVWGIPASRDLTNHFRFALPFYDSLRAGNFYPGWLAESNAGYGDASFRFYPPALYYLLALARMITGNWSAATLLTATLLFIVGGLGVTFWARVLGYGQTAVWAGILYTVAPYHLNQFFQSFMFAEFAGAAILPFAFAFTEKVCREGRSRDIAGLAVAYALLILTHLPLAIIGSIALFVYAMLRLDSTKRRATLARLSGSVALGLAASACYWATLLLELNWIRADNINPDPSVDYRQNFVLSTFSPAYLNVWWMNILLLATVAMFWPALALLRKSSAHSASENRTEGQSALKAMGAVVMLTIIMATPLSRPIWNLLRPLQQTQFPWRWLSLTSIVCPVLVAAAIPFWKRIANGGKRALAMIAAGTAVLAFTFSASHVIREANWLTPSQFEQQLSKIPGSPGVSQWWPAWVHEPVQIMLSPVEAGDRKVAIDSWEPEHRVFHIGEGQSTTARVRTFFYPHWLATAEGQSLAVSHDKDGAMLISLPGKQITISMEFREPARVRYARVLTFAGWILIGLLVIKPRQLFGLSLNHQS
jgi:6-pyruvoyl-tetrahydropterin synthase related domain